MLCYHFTGKFMCFCHFLNQFEGFKINFMEKFKFKCRVQSFVFEKGFRIRSEIRVNDANKMKKFKVCN